jgi:hypothetical protein
LSENVAPKKLGEWIKCWIKQFRGTERIEWPLTLPTLIYKTSLTGRRWIPAPYSPVRSVQAQIHPVIAEWAGDLLLSVSVSGSFIKGTANNSGTDIDLFISLSEYTPETLKEIYESLFARLSRKGYSPKRQNVSINVKVNGYNVDLVPAKQRGAYSTDHSLYRQRADTWTKTNVTTHVSFVRQHGRLDESRILKLWRNQKRLDFPSFYLELTVISALPWEVLPETLSGNVWKFFQYLRDSFASARVTDPANTNNIISDDLTVAEKATVKAAATTALSAKTWGEIVV